MNLNGRTHVAASAIVALFLTAPKFGYSHHSFLAYDHSQLVGLEGEVSEIVWKNPHVLLFVSVTSENGEEELWEREGDSVNTLQRAGLQAEMFNVGDTVRLRGLATTRDEKQMRPVLITLANELTLVLDENVARTFGIELESVELPTETVDREKVELAMREANGIFRVWTNRGWSQDSRRWSIEPRPLQDAARIARDAWDQASDDLAGRCIPAGMPEAQMNPFPIEFSEQDGNIVLRIEEWDNRRVIHMGNDDNPEDQPASPLGYSVGTWEDDTLVVRTSRINYPFFDDRGTPQSEAVEILERFSLTEDDTRLTWQATVLDPETFTEPVAMPELRWEWVPGEELREYNCSVSSN